MDIFYENRPLILNCVKHICKIGSIDVGKGVVVVVVVVVIVVVVVLDKL